MQWEFWFIVLGIPLAVFGFVFVIRATIQEHKQKKAALERLEKLREEDWEEYLKEGRRYLDTYPDYYGDPWWEKIDWTGSATYNHRGGRIIF